ncbi:MAG: coat protein, partial [Verrucomicrobiota bacterium]
DTLPVRNGTTDGQVYTTYLFGPGAFGKGVAPLSGEPLQGGFGTEAVELARLPLDSDTVLVNRRRWILHPRGVKFNSAAVAGDSPTNAELENGANWSRVFENKNVRIVAIDHNN